LEVVAVDANPGAPGLGLADVSRVVDIRDISGCLAVAEEFGVEGLVSICTEAAVETVAALGEALGLPAIGRDTALYATDKYEMRKRFAAVGLAGPAFRRVGTLEQARDAAGEIGYPLVIKPVDNSGSRGIRRVDGASSLEPAFEFALSQSRKQMVIIEEYMEGQEATIEALTYEGETEILAMSDKEHVPFPDCVAICLTYPPHFSTSIQNEMQDVVKRAVTSLGIQHGPTHTEVMVTQDGIKMVELGARGGGFGIFSHIIPTVSGVDIVQESIKIAMGMVPNIKAKHQHAAVLRFFNPQIRGTVQRVEGVELAAAQDGIIEVVVDAAPGQTIGPISADGDRPGYVIARGETRELAVERADLAERTVRFHVQPITTPGKVPA
jgi:biotin carboxylase